MPASKTWVTSNPGKSRGTTERSLSMRHLLPELIDRTILRVRAHVADHLLAGAPVPPGPAALQPRQVTPPRPRLPRTGARIGAPATFPQLAATPPWACAHLGT